VALNRYPTTDQEKNMTNDKETVKVWDPLVRIGHWTLVIAFFTAYFTEEDLLTPHIWVGYVVGAYVLIRIMWGFIGNKYARFSDFVYSPVKVIEYLKNLVKRKPQHYVGHNPAGGVMVVALLISLAGTTVTGLKLYAVEENKGPFALSAKPVDKLMPSSLLISEAKAEDDGDEEEGDEETESISDGIEVDKHNEDFWEESHEVFANLTLFLVFMHVVGVIASSIIDKDKLVKAMLTGKKEIDDSYH
jgi:cytochrome b